MSKYDFSMIYKLYCKDSAINEYYIGSTTNFNERMCGHRSDCCNENGLHYNYPVYKYIREHGGWRQWTAEILEVYPCANKTELHTRERHYIELLKPSLNRDVPMQTMKEYREKNKEKIKIMKQQYNEEHKEEIAEYQKKYREEHKEELQAKRKEYYENNKTTILSKCKEYRQSHQKEKAERDRKYREKNKEAIKKKKGERILCECGRYFTKSNENRHKRTAFHKNNI